MTFGGLFATIALLEWSCKAETYNKVMRFLVLHRLHFLDLGVKYLKTWHATFYLFILECKLFS